ncbi:FCP1 homology domain [Trypanosoma melophagium]|uniref:FCP1 homology domain n=1 Tax=Trypanosoma melophagium TaxID=715481 RepID=UPI00351A3B78|nr:FCP1 homology domain [Trypanosoma melophagium]
MQSVRWLLNLAIPCVVHFCVQTVLDGLLAWKDIHKTLCVLFCFFTGRSHLAYPHSLQQLKGKKAELARYRNQANSSSHVSTGGSSTPEWLDSSLDDALTRESRSNENNYTPSERDDNLAKGKEDTSEGEWWVQRRLLRGCKGEISEWLPFTRVVTLVSLHYHLCYSESLHRLVGNVVGPIQQPTISALPTRHTAPQWPPHSYGRSATRHGIQRDDLSLTTDEYSSTASARSRSQWGTMADNSNDMNSSRFISGVTSVVYRRESSKQVQFDRYVGSRMPLHSIASITSHHVLSYQATRQKVLIMDLDETLCFVSTKIGASHQPPTFSEVIPTASGAELFHVWERPHVRLFLNTMARLFNIVLFTSSTKPYADSILRRLDPDHLIKRRYYRQHCRQVPRSALVSPTCRSDLNKITSINSENSSGVSDVSQSVLPGLSTSGSTCSVGETGNLNSLGGGVQASTSGISKTPKISDNTRNVILVKDLRILKVPPELMIMIDNVEECVVANRDNALIIPPFLPRGKIEATNDDAGDSVLRALMPLLEALLVVPDVRSILRHGNVVLADQRANNGQIQTVSDV